MHSRWITALVAASAAIMTLNVKVVTIALPDINGYLEANLSDAQWIVNGYVLVFAVLLLGARALSGHMPRHRLFIAGHAIFGLASLRTSGTPGRQKVWNASHCCVCRCYRSRVPYPANKVCPESPPDTVEGGILTPSVGEFIYWRCWCCSRDSSSIVFRFRKRNHQIQWAA